MASVMTVLQTGVGQIGETKPENQTQAFLFSVGLKKKNNPGGEIYQKGAFCSCLGVI